MPASEETKTSWPDPRSLIAGARARASRIGDSRFTRMARATSLALRSSSRPEPGSPALATSRSIGPPELAAVASSSAAPASARSETTTAWPPPGRSAARASSSSPFRSSGSPRRRERRARSRSRGRSHRWLRSAAPACRRSPCDEPTRRRRARPVTWGAARAFLVVYERLLAERSPVRYSPRHQTPSLRIPESGGSNQDPEHPGLIRPIRRRRRLQAAPARQLTPQA